MHCGAGSFDMLARTFVGAPPGGGAAGLPCADRAVDDKLQALLTTSVTVLLLISRLFKSI